MSIPTPIQSPTALLTRIAEPLLQRRFGEDQQPGRRQAQGTTTTTRSSSSAASSPTGINGSFQLGGGTPPSVYLICFCVIIILLVSISGVITLRAMRYRRRLHVAWRRTGYSDAFFDTISDEDMARSGMMGGRSWPTVLGGGSGSGKETKIKQVRPVMYEIGMGWESEKSGSDEKGKARGGGRGDASWEGIEPISTTLLLPNSNYTSSQSYIPTPAPLYHPAPSFWQSLTSAPIRPPPPPPPPPIPPKPVEEILKAGARVEISVLIALPCESEGGKAGWEEEVRSRRRAAASASANGGRAGEVEEDEGEELPEVWLGVAEGVGLIDWEDERREKGW